MLAIVFMRYSDAPGQVYLSLCSSLALAWIPRILLHFEYVPLANETPLSNLADKLALII